MGGGSNAGTTADMNIPDIFSCFLFVYSFLAYTLAERWVLVDSVMATMRVNKLKLSPEVMGTLWHPFIVLGFVFNEYYYTCFTLLTLLHDLPLAFAFPYCLVWYFISICLIRLFFDDPVTRSWIEETWQTSLNNTEFFSLEHLFSKVQVVALYVYMNIKILHFRFAINNLQSNLNCNEWPRKHLVLVPLENNYA